MPILLHLCACASEKSCTLPSSLYIHTMLERGGRETGGQAEREMKQTEHVGTCIVFAVSICGDGNKPAGDVAR